MLSRAAGNLYWAGRYMERADFVSRLIFATQRLAALPTSYGGDVAAWRSALAAAGVGATFEAAHAELTEEAAVEFLTVDPANPSCLRGCIEAARRAARAVRTSLTLEAWEALNSAWMDVERFHLGLDRAAVGRLLEGVTASVLAFDGAAHRTMLRHDSYHFMRLGASIERADNTARLLDVKHHLLLPRNEPVGGSLDYFQWTTILRTVSALTAYRHVYRANVKPWLVADLLILNRQMPRSLAAAVADAQRYLDELAQTHGRRGPAHRAAQMLMHDVSGREIGSIFAGGLDSFIHCFIGRNNALGDAVAQQYLF